VRNVAGAGTFGVNRFSDLVPLERFESAYYQVGLGRSYNTTHEHVGAIYRKFGVDSRSALMVLWIGSGA
jgi:hypothetical protein